MKDGFVTLSGRVGTEMEKQVADHMLSDVIGLEDYSNDIFVDPIRRDLRARGGGRAGWRASSDREEDSLLGGSDVRHDGSRGASAPPTTTMRRCSARTTTSSVMENGVPWIPPDEPTPEGRDANLIV